MPCSPQRLRHRKICDRPHHQFPYRPQHPAPARDPVAHRAATLGIADGPAAAVFRVAAAGGPISRDEATRATGSSIATVNRHVSAMIAAGLLRERPDLVAAGAVGRPRVPFEVDPIAPDRRHPHRCRRHQRHHRRPAWTNPRCNRDPHPRGASDAALATITASARGFAARWHRRRPLWVGVAIGGRVEPETGLVELRGLVRGPRPVTSSGPGSVSPSRCGARGGDAASELLLTPQRADKRRRARRRTVLLRP